MFPILDVPTAQATILKRVPMDELDIPESLLQRLEQTFGEPVSPAEAVRRILRDVRTGGDAALSRWTAKLDAADLPTARVPQEKIAAALESLDPALRAAMQESAARIEQFYRRQPIISWIDQTWAARSARCCARSRGLAFTSLAAPRRCPPPC
jgi:histidinol dehydrogenase